MTGLNSIFMESVRPAVGTLFRSLIILTPPPGKLEIECDDAYLDAMHDDGRARAHALADEGCVDGDGNLVSCWACEWM